MSYWLLKSEPSSFSFADLLASPKTTTCWDGVRNYQARNFMRDGMRKGDLAFFYHSSTEPPGIAGIVEIVRAAYPDPSAFDSASDYYDARTSPDDPAWLMVDVRAKRMFDELITLAELRETPGLDGMELLRRGSRLSVQPVQAEHWDRIVALRPKG